MIKIRSIQRYKYCLYAILLTTVFMHCTNCTAKSLATNKADKEFKKLQKKGLKQQHKVSSYEECIELPTRYYHCPDSELIIDICSKYFEKIETNSNLRFSQDGYVVQKIDTSKFDYLSKKNNSYKPILNYLHEEKMKHPLEDSQFFKRELYQIQDPSHHEKKSGKIKWKF